MKNKLLLSLLAFSSITLSSCYVDLGFIQLGKKPEEQSQEEINKDGDSTTPDTPGSPIDTGAPDGY